MNERDPNRYYMRARCRPVARINVRRLFARPATDPPVCSSFSSSSSPPPVHYSLSARLLDPKSHNRISLCCIFTRFPVQIGAFLTTRTTSLVLLGLVLPVSVGPHFLGISSHCECGSAFKRRQANRRFDKAPHGGVAERVEGKESAPGTVSKEYEERE